MTSIEPSGTVSSEKPCIYSSSGFPGWLNTTGLSIVFTTYQAGRIFFLGLKQDGSLWAHERLFEHCQGLWCNDQEIWISSVYQLWHLRNRLQAGESDQKGCDRVFVPQLSYVTGNLDCHDITVDKNGKPIFVNTRFNCLATVSETGNFKPIWKPFFISELIMEDRCHLNGLAAENGIPLYVTAISKSDVLDGWRDKRRSGGVVINVKSNEIIASGLSMPHSPRLYQDKLWILNSGTGEFGTIDKKTGQFEPVCFCPGYARGLSFVDDYAVIGLSLQRDNHTFEGLELDENLKRKDTEPRCGLIIVNLKSGVVEEWVRIEGIITELYDVSIMPKARQPMVVGIKNTEEISNLIHVDNS